MSFLTFDWAQVVYGLGSPCVSQHSFFFDIDSMACVYRLATPWWAQVNIMSGFVFFFCKCHIMTLVVFPSLDLLL